MPSARVGRAFRSSTIAMIAAGSSALARGSTESAGIPGDEHAGFDLTRQVAVDWIDLPKPYLFAHSMLRPSCLVRAGEERLPGFL